MTYSYYIYYRVLDENLERAESCVRRLLAFVESRTGVGGRWLTKRGEPYLWMEVYEGITDDAAFERELARAVSALGARDFLRAGSDRHIECFEAQDSRSDEHSARMI